MELEAQFRAAAERVHTLTERPSNETLLLLYALFKQATEGDISGERPGFFDLKAMAKYTAWEECRGMEKPSAMQKYINLVDSLFAK